MLDLGERSSLAVPLCEAGSNTSLDVGFFADDVLLCLEAPRGMSARNALPCRAVAVEMLGQDVLVSLRIGETDVFARVTPAAAEELGLAPGLPLVAVVKTAAIHLLSGTTRDQPPRDRRPVASGP
jgi:molybdate transport system ATP-binding protein